jgi:hypothetical protein
MQSQYNDEALGQSKKIILICVKTVGYNAIHFSDTSWRSENWKDRISPKKKSWLSQVRNLLYSAVILGSHVQT